MKRLYFLFLLIGMLPLSFGEHIDMRSTLPKVNVQASKHSPAFYALMAVELENKDLQPINDEQIIESKYPAIELVAGRIVKRQVNAVIIKSNVPTEQVNPLTMSLATSEIRVKGRGIEPAHEGVSSVMERQQDVEPLNKNHSLSSFNDHSVESNHSLQSVMDTLVKNELRQRAHKRVLSLTKRDHLQQRLPQQVLTTEVTSQPMRLGAQVVQEKNPLTTKTRRFDSSQAKEIAKSSEGNQDQSIKQRWSLAGGPQPNQMMGQTMGFGLKDSLTSQIKEQTRYLCRGEVSLSGGLAYTGDDFDIEIIHQSQGRTLNHGVFDYEQAKYKIKLSDLTGKLIARLLNSQGLVVGLAEYDLASLPEMSLKSYKISHINFNIEPVVYGLTASISSADAFAGQVKQVKNPQLYIEHLNRKIVSKGNGEFQDQNIVHPSTYLLRAEAQGYWKTLMMATSQDKAFIKLFSEKLLSQYMSNVGVLQKGGVIAGEVVDENNQPISGAQVEIDHDSEVHYLSSFFIDKKLSSTSDNGKFLIFSLLEDGLSIRVKYGGDTYPAVVVPVQEGAVTQYRYKLIHQKEKRIHIQAYELFTEGLLEGEVLNYENELLFNTFDQVDNAFKIMNGLWSALYVSSEYLISAFYSSDEQKIIEVPIVPKGWLASIRDQAQKQKMQRLSFLGVLKAKKRYDVFVDGEFAKVLSFDSTGEVLPAESLKSPYGFAIADLSEGFHSIQVTTSNGVEIFNHLTYITQDRVITRHFNTLE